MVYVHEETTSGIHHYALYSINWFSRVSGISNKRETDYTEFPKQNTLLPPANLAVQLIQTENPRIFTSAQEQLDLAAITDPDKTYVRITFDWNQIHNSAYQTATGVELFWREAEPLVVRGKIKTGAGAIVVDPVNRTVDVETEGFYNASVDQTITPEILAGDESRFVGARLTIDGDSFIIESVLVSGVNPTFRLKQIRVTASQDVENNDIFCTTEEWLSPEEGKRFLIAENLDSAGAWDEQLAGTVSIEQFSSHSETVTYNDGTSKVFQIGGLTGSGTIVDIPDPDPDIVTDHVPVGGPSEVPTGVYTITYDSELLPAHPNSDPNLDVDYHSGTVRLDDVDGNIKTLNVWKIEESGGVTVLTAYDPTFGLVRGINGDFVLTGSDFTPVEGYTPIQLGSVSFINFHPSYRVYVKKGTGASTFIDDNILPDTGDGTKNTYIAVRSIDDTVSPDPCQSFMTVPSVLLAREIVEPVPPGVPTGPLFATRPDFYGKATYTFDVEVENPFALIFYRANERKILDQLYKPDTVADILDELAALESPDKDFFQDRWSELVNVVYDPGTFEFKEYTPGGFKFRIPDNNLYKIPHANNSVNEFPFATAFNFSDSYTYTDPDLGSVTISMVDVVKQAIEGAFLPLTEIPPVYNQLQDKEFQTSGRKPVVRNPETGKRYLPDHMNYDPWPMALRFEKDVSENILQFYDPGYGDSGNTRFVRFTDYTLDGASSNFYFYFGVELAATLAVSDRSPISGPIQLVNSQATVAPEIKKTVVQSYNKVERTPTAVKFELNEYLESDGIKKINLYRTNNPEKALSVRTMDLVKSIDFGEEVIDKFEDQLFPLFGDPLFYRVVVSREIINEQGEAELIPSIPSNLVLTNVIDNQHPTPPTPKVSHNAPTGSPVQVDDVKLTFRPTTYNATYFVYMEGAKGNWTMIKQLSPEDHENVAEIEVQLVDTDLGSGLLDKQDVNLNPIYYNFRVDVENSSGLPNVKKEEVTI